MVEMIYEQQEMIAIINECFVKCVREIVFIYLEAFNTGLLNEVVPEDQVTKAVSICLCLYK